MRCSWWVGVILPLHVAGWFASGPHSHLVVHLHSLCRLGSSKGVRCVDKVSFVDLRYGGVVEDAPFDVLVLLEGFDQVVGRGDVESVLKV